MEDNKSGSYVVKVSAIIPARRERVYSILANYHDGHPRILPRQFSGLSVEQGGVGAGTVIRFQMSMLGKRQTCRASITEPEPGRVLMETFSEPAGIVTTFTVDPGNAPADSLVTILTVAPVRAGWAGTVERFVSPLLLRPIYAQELSNLARVATGPFALQT